MSDDKRPATGTDEQSAISGGGEPADPPIWSASLLDDRATLDPSDDAASSRPVAGGRSALRRPRNLVLVGVAVVVLILALIFGPIGWELWSQKDVRITTPAHVADLVLDDSQGARDTVDYLRTAVETGVSLEKTTGAVYADGAGQSRSVLFIGGTGVLVSPGEALTKTFGLIADDAGGVENVHEVPAGALGGTMRCGTTQTDGGSMAVCGWADHGSLGIAMFPNRPADQSAELLRTMRNAMQSRG
jgi:hypothetical protein